MNASTAESEQGLVPPRARPGVLLNGGALLLFGIAVVRGSERTGDLDSILLIAAAWALWALAWLFRLVAAAGSGHLRSDGFARWLVVPGALAAAIVLVFGGYALGARFGLSRAALEAAAETATSGRHVEPGWIGLYPVERVSLDDESVRVEVAGQLALVRDAPVSDSSSIWYDRVDGRWSIEYDASGD